MNDATRAIAAAAVAVGVAGCAGTSAPAARLALPDVAAPAAWHAPRPEATAPARPAGGPVEPAPAAPAVPTAASALDAPDLSPLVDAALQASPTLAAAAARIEQARAALVAADAARRPLVDGVAAMARNRADPSLPAASVGSLGLQAAWELDLFGGARAAAAGAAARLAASAAAQAAARVALAAEVATAYTALRGCEAQGATAAADATSRDETARVTDQGARAGLIAPATAALARASAAQARVQVAALQAQCDALVKSLVALTALDEAALRRQLEPGRGRLPRGIAAPVPAVPAALLGRRPDLDEAARRVEAAAADVAVAQAQRRPRVTLAGSVSATTLRSAGATLDGSSWSIGPLQVSLPLFDGGARAAREQAARAAYDDAVADYRGRLRQAVREVETALVALESTAWREADTRLAAEGFDTSFRATEARFRGGLASAFELEDARRTRLAAQSALVELQRERATAWIDLHRALGGAWPEPAALPAAGR